MIGCKTGASTFVAQSFARSMKYFFCLFFLLIPFTGWLQTPDSLQTDSIRQYELNPCTILDKEDGLFTYLPGSTAKIDQTKLKEVQPFTLNEMLRKVPGINVTDEEGVGLRIDIGIRGMDSERSRGIHMMEDGIPIALGPYGENESYYSPLIDRMSSIEVLKGSGQILYGPQTVGGIINFITADPPTSGSKLNVKFMGGTGLNFLGSVNYGQGFKNGGFSISYIRKQGENVGPTWYRINDVVAKFVLKISDRSKISFKAGFYNEISNSTYVGLTQTMWENGQYFQVISPNDRMVVNRYSGSMQHEWKIRSNLIMTTTLFGYRTSREWRRQEFSSSLNAQFSGTVWGDTTIAGGAIYMMNTTGLRYRYFDVAGIENKFLWNFKTGKVSQRIDAGVRFIYERANENYLEGATVTSETGTPYTDEIRNGYGLAVYAQDKLFLHKNFTVTAGLRGEFFWFNRNFNLLNGVDTSYGTKTFVPAIIPGVGLNYKAGKYVNIFSGVHRGFAPPEVKDAATNLGAAVQLGAQDSWNVELGARTNIKQIFTAELTGFYMDFLNQVVQSSVTAGNSTGLVNGGATRHIGIEAAFMYDIAKHAGWNNYKLAIEAAFTYQYVRYSNDRYVVQGSDTIDLKNNQLPYAPSIMANASVTLQTAFGLGLRFSGNYVGQQFTDELNTVLPTADGRIGLIPGYFTLDGNASYKIPKIRTTVRLSVKNMTDNRYIASRRPMGIKVGIPLFIMAGFEFQL